jgi:hypothetical protein
LYRFSGWQWGSCIVSDGFFFEIFLLHCLMIVVANSLYKLSDSVGSQLLDCAAFRTLLAREWCSVTTWNRLHSLQFYDVGIKLKFGV